MKLTSFIVGLTLAYSPFVFSKDISECKGYTASNIRENGATISADLMLKGQPCNLYGEDIKNLKLLVEYQSDKRLHVKIFDADQKVFQIPPELLAEPTTNPNSKSELLFNIVADPFSFSVQRKSNNETLFDTTGQSLVFESQYLRLRTHLPNNPNIYGLGESADPFRHDPNNYSHTIWTAGEPFMPQNANLYGDFPVYYDHRGSKGIHAVYLRNSNGMRINMGNDTGNNYLEYNTIGGVFDFYFLSGPTPKDTSAQFAEIIGYPALMPYWGFGFHQCRFGYQDAYETAAVVANYSTAKIPLETIWNDIDYMDYRATFSLDPIRFRLDRMQALIKHLHQQNQQYIMMLDPAVAARNYKPYNDGLRLNALMKESNGSVYTGVVWAGPSSFPDWFAPNVQQFWNEQFDSFFNSKTGVDIDGLWIDMNEPSNFCDYPCENPGKFAVEARNPPRPPPARMYSPYAIPGFPGEFQPHCMVTALFEVTADVHNGEDLLLFGNTLSMGNNTGRLAPEMRRNDKVYTLTVQLPANANISYSYVRYTREGEYIKEKMMRGLQTKDCGSSISIKDDSQYPKLINRDAIKQKGLPDRNLLEPAYDIKNYFGRLSGQTMPTNLYHANGLAEYDVHNFYGSLMGATSRKSLVNRRPGRRPLIITRSSIAGDGTRVGHWFGDNRSTDDDYRLQVVQMIQFPSMFQLPMVGSDVCGFNFNTNPTLCARWAVLGAWNPFYRNHAEISSISQEFYRWDIVADAARKAIDTRYKLLDYLYTNFYHQHKTGAPILSPVMWQYPEDPNTFALELQFFYGDALLVCPVTDPKSTSVGFYMPKDTFYDFFTHEKIQGKGEMVTRDNISYSDIPVYIRGGHIVPMRVNSAMTTTALRNEDFELIIAPDEDGNAKGSLYLDDGESIDVKDSTLIRFTFQEGTLVGEGEGEFGFDAKVKISKVTVLGERSKCGKAVNTVDLPLTKGFKLEVGNC